MSTNEPGFQSFSTSLHHFVLDKLATRSMRVNDKYSIPAQLLQAIGIHWIAFTEYSQMSTHLPGIQTYSANI